MQPSIRITFSSNGHPVVVQVGQDLLGQVVAQGQLLEVRAERGPASAPESLQRRFRNRWNRRRRDVHVAGLLVVIGRKFRNGVEEVRPSRLDPESVGMVSVPVSARFVGGSAHCIGFTVKQVSTNTGPKSAARYKNQFSQFEKLCGCSSVDKVLFWGTGRIFFT